MALAALMGGVLGVAVAAVALAASPPWFSRRTTARHLRHEQHRMPELCHAIARGVRGGVPLGPAVADALDGFDENAFLELRAAALLVRHGHPVDETFERWASEAADPTERLMARALAFGLRAGGDLGRVLDDIAGFVRDDLALFHRRRALVAQARASAVILISLPLVFALVIALVRGGPIHEGAIGAALLVAGLLFDGLGLLWMRRLAGGVG
ncbi:MAG: type II secretion system F family protein [Acidimicrobiales bacterium]